MKGSVILNGKFLAGPATGVQRVAAEMIKALDTVLSEATAARTFDVELLTPYIDASQLHLKNVSTTYCGSFRGIPWEQFDLPRLAKGRLIINLANLGPILAPHAITMIHDAQTFSSPRSYGAAFRKWYSLIQPILGKRNHRILTVSEFSKKQLATYGVAATEQIEVIHNGADHVLAVTANPAAVSRFGLTPRRYVLGLANTQPHKNIIVLIRAFESEKLKTIELVLFGYASRSALEALYGHALPKNVKIAGKISDEDLRGLLEAALCLGFPSTTEGFGLPPLEAMLLGCPAIVSPCGALPEICGTAALYADPDNPELWISAISDLADDPQAWNRASTIGKTHASLFQWRNSAKRLLEVIERYR